MSGATGPVTRNIPCSGVLNCLKLMLRTPALFLLFVLVSMIVIRCSSFLLVSVAMVAVILVSEIWLVVVDAFESL